MAGLLPPATTSESFERDGVVVLEGCLDSRELGFWDEATACLDSHVARNILDAGPVRERCIAGPLGEWASELARAAATRCVRGLFFDKRKSANWFVPWHQDTLVAVGERPERGAEGFSAWTVKAGVHHVRPPQRVLDGMVTLRIALDDARLPEEGALKVIPGSHLGGVLGPADVARAAGEGERRVASVSRGDVLAMRPLLLHASSRSRSDGGRRVIHLEYAPEGSIEPLRWRWA